MGFPSLQSSPQATAARLHVKSVKAQCPHGVRPWGGVAHADRSWGSGAEDGGLRPRCVEGCDARGGRKLGEGSNP
ncbi:hypothetical protein NPIL_24641 [Nephila pilipes]|uniref:Uncharacterized protein n=1 Tax=Nephila pilipes TaxID=299642 RepID=A0A8X6UT06_NEPPI|nr:hypothetical protein NPIL_24641 [Nephila pilipes]